MLTWHYVTRAAYDAASTAEKSADKIFFLSDTGEIYRGTENFTQSVTLYTEVPTTPAVGRLYINSTTLEGRIWTGTTWTTVINPVVAAVDSANETSPVSGKAVADYVSQEVSKVTGSSGELISGITYDSATNTFTVTNTDDTTETIELTSVAADLEYDKATGKLNVVNMDGNIIGEGVNLDLERFISDASYDHETKMVTLVFNDESDPLEFSIGDLVDTYTADDTDTVHLAVTGNQFTAEVIVSQTEGNMLQATENGLYVAAVDVSGKMDLVEGATAGNVATLTAEGQAADSGVSVGGATLSEGAPSTVLATEAAVAAIRTALQASIDAKMGKVGTGHDNEIIVAGSDGDAVASGVKVGGETLSATPDSATLATEKAVAAYITANSVAKDSVVGSDEMATTVAAASDENVVSEKAVVNAVTWKTTV